MSSSFHRALGRWPAGVKAGPFLFFSGQMGIANSGLPCSSYSEVGDRGATSPYDWVNRSEAPVGAQAVAVYDRYLELLGRRGLALDSLLRYHIFQRDKHFFSVFDRMRREREQAPPASTAVGVGRFAPDDAVRLCIDAIALDDPRHHDLGPRSVHRGASAFATAAHFSHVVQAGPYRFLAGQIPVDTSTPGAPLIRGYDDVPEAGRFLKVGRSHEDTRNGPIATQTWFTYDLIRQHLEACGSAMADILNLVVYLQDMRDFALFHRVHEHFFPDEAPPALTVVEVGEVGHKGTLIEIEATAIARAPGYAKRTWPAARRDACLSAAAEAGGLTFLSNVPGVGPAGEPVAAMAELPAAWRRYGPVRSTRGPCVAAQTAAVIGQLAGQMKQLQQPLSRITHLTLFLRDIDDFRIAGPLLERAFGKARPALLVIESPHPSPVSAVEVSATAIAWTGAEAPSAL